MAGLIRRFLYEPPIIKRQAASAVLGAVRLNVSDVRDLMRELDSLPFVEAARASIASMPDDTRPATLVDHVQLITNVRSTSSRSWPRLASVSGWNA